MTDAERAKRLGISNGLYSRYRGRGMPESEAAARRWIAVNVRARIKPNGQNGSHADAPAVHASGYMDARTAREKAEAEAAQIRVLEARAELVRRATIRQEVGRRLNGLREALLQIPARLQSVLAAETDEGKVHDILQDEIYAALASVTDAAG